MTRVFVPGGAAAIAAAEAPQLDTYVYSQCPQVCNDEGCTRLQTGNAMVLKLSPVQAGGDSWYNVNFADSENGVTMSGAAMPVQAQGGKEWQGMMYGVMPAGDGQQELKPIVANCSFNDVSSNCSIEGDDGDTLVIIEDRQAGACDGVPPSPVGVMLGAAASGMHGHAPICHMCKYAK